MSKCLNSHTTGKPLLPAQSIQVQHLVCVHVCDLCDCSISQAASSQCVYIGCHWSQIQSRASTWGMQGWAVLGLRETGMGLGTGGRWVPVSNFRLILAFSLIP